MENKVTAIAREVRQLADCDFEKPGPLFNEIRRGIISQWFTNFACNLEAVVYALRKGRDMAGNTISPMQVAEGLARMCVEYEKMLNRLADVCGTDVCNRFHYLLRQASDMAIDLARGDTRDTENQTPTDVATPTTAVMAPPMPDKGDSVRGREEIRHSPSH